MAILVYGIVTVLMLSPVVSQGIVLRKEIQRHLELEDVLSEVQLRRQKNTPGLEYWIWRSEANNLKVLRIEDMYRQYSVNIRLCISPDPPGQNVTIRLENIRYSNDGPSDTLYLLLNNRLLGIFRTYEKWGSGHEWNVFHNTGPIGEAVDLPEGQYTLSLQARTDRWGVEYDRIEINAEFQNEFVDLICDSELVEP